MSSRKPIRFSTWTLTHKKFKNDVRVAREVIVTGEEEDISSIKNNSLYLGWAYRAIFGKGKFIKKRKEDQYIVTKIELDSKILGYVQTKEGE